MICIFCKHDSSASKSVEHVIPQSMGNLEHTLPAGVVCDRCNTYFGQKVEKPLMETQYFRDLCFRARIKNKKGNPPRVLGLHLQSLTEIEIFPDMDGYGVSVAAANQNDEKRWIQSIASSKSGTLIVPIETEPNQLLLSRFLAKVAMEALALRAMDVPGGLQEIIDKRELDPLREYVCKGGPPKFWTYHERRLYPPDFVFYENGYGSYEILHEWTFLYTEIHELYLILALFGVEYAINLGGPEIDGFKQWLSINSGQSPLYLEGITNSSQMCTESGDHGA
jgi:hypothetical protein